MLNWLGRLLRGSSGAARRADPEALVREALAHQQSGRFDAAERLFYRALALLPASAAIQLHLGNLYSHLGRHNAALGCCKEAVSLAPNSAQAYNNLGTALRGVGQEDAAIAAFRAAIGLDPDLAEAHHNLGIALQRAGEAREAAACYRAGLRLRPEFAPSQLNLGLVLQEEGDVEGAIAAYRSAIGIDPGLVEAHVNLGLQLLLAGRYSEGWAEYEWRLRYDEYGAAGRGAQRWQGEELQGRKIVLDAEQGFGDALQFLRYAQHVAARGGAVTVRCAPRLLQLFRSAPGVQEATSREAPMPQGLYCPLPSLPLLFGTTVETVPAPIPYLRAEAGQAAHWKARLEDGTTALRVGLVWASQSRQNTAAARSLSLAALAPLAEIPGLRFYSLQRDAAAREAAQPPAGMSLVDLASELGDFSDDAAVLENLDLLISVDTAIVHLAGAMGRPVWILLKHVPDWRWLLGRDDSPWYPSMRLFRQQRSNDWSAPIESAAQALRQFAAAARS
jgi:tetratricopeptide (TPR) repeat protein